MTKLYFTGYNGFKQFKNRDELMVTNMTEWTVDGMTDITAIKFCSSWSVNVLAISTHLLISGCLKGVFGQTKKLTFSDKIRAISSELCELNFLGVDQNSSLSDETPLGKKSDTGVVEHIACGHTFSVAVTSTNVVYNIPSRIYEFPKHVKVKKVSCGAEHALILTTNGDVYSWGSSSRGQLGLSQLDSELMPTLIEGLAGVKITDISCGLWHSAAVSAFGDLYMWGWNFNGQLGKSIYTNVKVNFENGRSDMVRHKDSSVFASPQVIDLPVNSLEGDDVDLQDENRLEGQFHIEKVDCGSRHTVIRTKCEKILGCGFNRYGQLNKSDDHNIDKFVEMELNGLTNPINVLCGSWCTLFMTK